MHSKTTETTLAHITSVAFLGFKALPIDIEVDLRKSDKLSLVFVGLPDLAVKESKDRVLSAIKNTGYRLDTIQCTVNLAPGDRKKEGPLYDLPIALGLLYASGSIPSVCDGDFLCVGELSLSGHLRPMRGALAAALLAKSQGKKGIILPAENAREASVVSDLAVIGVDTLKEAIAFLQHPHSFSPTPYVPPQELETGARALVDLSEIKGQLHAKRALEIAAAGNHNLLFFGPPGSGKTLLAKAMAGILPPLSLEEALEVTQIHSITGQIPAGHGLVLHRPFRNPHHTVSSVGLVGGGNALRPGEISLAHQGILFLDELPEFSRSVLEVLRQPLENGEVTISRAAGSVTFPTRFLFVAAMNPCPCGFLGHPKKVCTDTPHQIHHYRSKISGPLLDRIDMHVEVPALPLSDLTPSSTSTHSSEIRKKVTAARKLQHSTRGKANAHLTNQDIQAHCTLDTPTDSLMRQAMEKMGLSLRSYHRILKVARTIADLDDSASIQKEHLMEALSFRSFDSSL